MGRQYRRNFIAIASIYAGMMGFSGVAWSQESEQIALEMVEISQSPEAQVRSGARPSFAQVITMPQLQSINDWLESANGVYGDATGKGTRNVIVRGFETRQIAFQFDGVPLDTGYDGMTGMDSIPMNWIGAGRIAHADASPTDAVGFGGKIDLYAFDPSVFEAQLEVSRFGVMGSIAHGMKYGDWHWAATVGGQYSEGFYMSHAYQAEAEEDGGRRDWSDKQGANFFVKAVRTLGDWGEVELMAGWSNAPRGVPTGIRTGYRRYWDFTSWRVAFASARLLFDTEVLSGQVQIWSTDQGNTLEAYDDASRSTQTSSVASTSVWQDDDYGGRIELNSPVWLLGGAGYLQVLLRTDLRYQLHASNETSHAESGGLSKKNSSRFFYDVRPAFDWQIFPELRIFASGNVMGTEPVSQGSENESGNTSAYDAQLVDIVNGGFSVGADYSVLDNLELNLRVARRLRIPTLKEQFRSVPELGAKIEPLNPEIAWDFEFEIHYRPIEKIALTVGAFDTEIRDLIEFKYIEGYKLSYNVSESRIAGVDISATFGPWFGVSLDASYHYLYAWDVSQDHELNDRPAHNFRFALHYEPIADLKFTIGGQYESKRRTEAWLSSKFAWMGDVFLLNAEIEYKLDRVFLYLRGSNLTDYNYSRSFGYPEPGYNISFGAKLTMD